MPRRSLKQLQSSQHLSVPSLDAQVVPAVAQPKVNALSEHYKTGGRSARKNRNAHAGELLPGIRRHVRYLSDFSANIIRLDVSHHQNEKESLIVEINLENQLVACVGKGSLYQSPKPLLDFPDAITVFKLALNRALFRNNNGMIKVGVNDCKRTFLRIFSWMTRRNIFQFSELTKEMLDTLVSDVASKGWAETLDQEKTLNNVLKLAKSDPQVIQKISNRFRNGGNYSIPLATLEELTGLPLHLHSIPKSFYQALAKIENDNRTITKIDWGKNKHESEATRSLVHTLNALSVSSEKSIQFYPFPKPGQTLSQAAKQARNHRKTENQENKKPGRQSNSLSNPPPAPNPTTNLTIFECVSIFSEALEWVYDYAPSIIKILKFARAKIKATDADAYWQRKTWEEIFRYYEREAKAAKIPIATIDDRHSGENSLRFVCRLLQKACQDLMGICSARRINEIIGNNGVPYGLYLGALVKVSEMPDVWSIDSYVSKGPQDWFKFPANKLMADTYAVLVELHSLHMPFDWVPAGDAEPLVAKRKQKLFPLGLLHPRPLNLAEAEPAFSTVGKRKFLELAGVDPARFENTMTPYRRLFCTLHMNRYDMPEEPALQHYLGQLNPNSAYGYFTDSSKRPVGESIREIHAPNFVDKDFLDELEISRLEYATATIKKMLDGEPVSGGFPVVVSKLTKQLSAQLSFAKLSSELKAQHLAKTLYAGGFRADPKKHTCCMGGAAKKADETANCFRNGALHKEEASPQRCKGCVNSAVTANSVKNVQREIVASSDAAANSKLPRALQVAHSNRANQLAEVLADEANAAQRNFQLFEKAEEAWKATVAHHLTARAAKSGKTRKSNGPP